MHKAALCALLFVALSSELFGHGFDVTVQSTPQGLQLFAINNGEPTGQDRMFAEYWFDSAPDDYKSIHGGIIKAGGFNGTVSLDIEFLSPLWFSDGSEAEIVSQGESILGTSFDGFDTLGSVTINATSASPGTFPVTGLSDHSLGWSLRPYPVAAGSYGFAYRVTGSQQNGAGTQTFLPSLPVVVVLSSPGFFGSGGFSVEDSRDELYDTLVGGGNNPPLAPNQWARPGGGAYHAASNWVDSPSPGIVPNGIDAIARFLGTITADSMVTIEAPVSVGALQFDNAHRYTLSGGSTMTLSSSTTAEIELTSGNHTIAAPLAIASDANLVAGAQTLTLEGAPSWSANKTLTVVSGTLAYNTQSAATSVGAGAKLVIASGSTVNVAGAADPFSTGSSRVAVQNDSLTGLNIAAGVKAVGAITGMGQTTLSADAQLAADSVRQAALMLHGSADHSAGRLVVRAGTGSPTLSVINALQLDSTAAAPDNNPSTPLNIYFAGLDLTRNKLVVDYSGASPAAAIRDALQAGFGPAQDWSGATGITTSLGDGSSLALGYAEATALFGSFPAQFAGQQVDSTSVLIAYTHYGDANLSGTTDFTDLGILLNNYNQAGGWSRGDFDYGGQIDFSDLGQLLNNYNQSVPALVATQSVPEPGGGLLAMTAAFALGGYLLRRRHHTHGR